MKTLDDIGFQYGTDKASNKDDKRGHDYLRHYEHFFLKYKTLDFELMEIGVLGGASLRTWLDYFSNCKILGIDITESCKSYESERVKIEIGRHDDIIFLRKLATTHSPSIIIEDGSHIWTHQVDIFETLFPALIPGGYYICEDLQICFGAPAEKYGDLAKQTSAQYFSKIAERILGDKPNKFTHPLERYLLSWIDAIYFCKGAVIIKKRENELYKIESHPRAKINQLQQKKPENN
jgi:hypothetical protein